MPKSHVEPCKVLRAGLTRWRVMLPSAITGGKKRAKYFETKAKAAAFARDMNAKKESKLVGLLRLSSVNQARLSGRAIIIL
jgi:hypothetical protein